MASILDVARYILNQHGPLSAMKLQKLCYYSQAWSLVWDDEPLFGDEIQAWANGPVTPRLYRAHKGLFTVRPRQIRGDARRLSANQRDTVDAVLRFYGNKKAYWLSQLTHKERPWREARAGLAAGTRGNRAITHAAMREYHESLV
ncbi:MAG: SocA family protein [Planctomycetes bacterium]|nr:SocA family protein [Planctomycetota bacterium]